MTKNHPRALAIIAALIFQSACVTTQESYLPDGSLGHHITCGGALFSMGDCMQKAGEICGAHGYQILNQNGEAIPFSTSSGAVNGTATPYGGGSITGAYNSTSGSIVNRDLFVKCAQTTGWSSSPEDCPDPRTGWPCRNRGVKSADLESTFYQWVAPRRAQQPIDIVRESALSVRHAPCGPNASSIETGPSPRRVDLAGKKSAGN
jgi:hypothetical protein